ncbi:MAG: hypothetical protein R3Y56_07135 [Akkermansia sp.]
MAALISVLFLLALCLRSLGDAHPLSGTSLMGCELWTLKAAVPLGCLGASLVLMLWAVMAAMLRHGSLASGCLMVALPMAICCCFVAPDVCLPFAADRATWVPIQAGAGSLLVFLLLNLAGGWALCTFCKSFAKSQYHPWALGLASSLLVAGLLMNTSLLAEALAAYYPAWELGFACWVSYASFGLLLIMLLWLRVWSKK